MRDRDRHHYPRPSQPPPDSHRQPCTSAAPLSEVPASMRWTRAFTRECTSCLKECLGIRAQKAQANVMKFQAPFSLITWYLFQNRPFKMWPIENLFRVLGNVRAPSNPRRHHWKSP